MHITSKRFERRFKCAYLWHSIHCNQDHRGKIGNALKYECVQKQQQLPVPNRLEAFAKIYQMFIEESQNEVKQ